MHKSGLSALCQFVRAAANGCAAPIVIKRGCASHFCNGEYMSALLTYRIRLVMLNKSVVLTLV